MTAPTVIVPSARKLRRIELSDKFGPGCRLAVKDSEPITWDGFGELLSTLTDKRTHIDDREAAVRLDRDKPHDSSTHGAFGHKLGYARRGGLMKQ
jgi:hypothetical protein